MIGVSTNAAAVAVDLGKVAAVVVRQGQVVVQQAGQDVADEWRRNAEETSGEHGKHYPKSIQSHMTGVLEATVAPQAGMAQAGMSFEYGSVNQPPHLDGQRAIDRLGPLIERRLESLLAFVT